jgi:hypothetical protein
MKFGAAIAPRINTIKENVILKDVLARRRAKKSPLEAEP